ncbi:MAG: hypothetical protein AAGL18_05850, partial [Pseudomonadota bacterium]
MGALSFTTARLSLISVSLMLGIVTGVWGSDDASAQGAEISQPNWVDGPHERLVIRNAILIDGTGAPPQGPMDIAVEKGRITQIRNIGAPGIMPIDARRLAPGTHE